MKTIESIRELRQALRGEQNKTIGLIPTMGFLHEGHMSLVDRAKDMCDIVVMSIFVNPLQFGPNEDLASYPRDLKRDSTLASARGVDYLFTPSVSEMYPSPNKTTVSVSGVTEFLCGASRPGHFDGVATVVSKLLNIVQPAYAFFGMKDAQQVAVIRQMVDDLNMPVTVVPCPIIREQDGLALSSRNVYLSEEERHQALVLSQAINAAREAFAAGEKSAETLKEMLISMISKSPLATIDYVEICNYPSLTEVNGAILEEAIVALAVRFGKTRLIDNAILTPVKEEAVCFVQ